MAPVPPPPPHFDLSARFAGARPGCVFKKGPQGVGYYVDAKQQAKQAKQAQQARSQLDSDTRGIAIMPYYVQSGAMIDWSTSSGYMKVSRSMNENAYGKVDAADVLAGRVPQPPECAALYAALDEYATRSR